MNSRGPSWYRFVIGGRDAWILTDGPLGKVPPAEEFPDVAPASMRELLDGQHLPTDHLTFEQNCLVIRTPQGLALFDTGMGASDLLGPDAGRLLRTFEGAGLDPADVTAVFLTHAHADHLFGLSAAGRSVCFPNAAIFISRADVEFWTSPETAAQNDFCAANVSGAKERLAAYADALRFVADGDEPLPGVTAIATPGHTVGHLSYLIGAGDERCLVLGDTAYHFAISFSHPEWHSSFDTDPVVAAETRLKILGFAADQRLRVIGYHFPFPGIGYVDRLSSASFRYVPEPMDLT